MNNRTPIDDDKLTRLLRAYGALVDDRAPRQHSERTTDCPSEMRFAEGRHAFGNFFRYLAQSPIHHQNDATCEKEKGPGDEFACPDRHRLADGANGGGQSHVAQRNITAITGFGVFLLIDQHLLLNQLPSLGCKLDEEIVTIAAPAAKTDRTVQYLGCCHNALRFQACAGLIVRCPRIEHPRAKHGGHPDDPQTFEFHT